MRRPPRNGALAALAAIAAAIAVLGCGDDDEPTAPEADAQQAFLTVAEVESVFERTMLDSIRTGGGDAPGDLEGLVDLVRFADQAGGREFELFVWETAAVARERRSSLLSRAREQHGEDVAAIRAANAIAVFPDDPAGVDSYSAAANAMSRLAAACIRGGSSERRLRRLCFGDEAVPPPGEGVDRDEAEEEGDTIVLDGIRYAVVLARRLNPNIVPDRQLVSGRRPPPGTTWWGVFLRACNQRAGEPRRPSARLALVNASGQRREPSELPANNAFDYEPEPIEPQECRPPEGSVAAQMDGALVLFAVSTEYLGDRPVALEVAGRGDSPRRMRLVLDI